MKLVITSKRNLFGRNGPAENARTVPLPPTSCFFALRRPFTLDEASHFTLSPPHLSHVFLLFEGQSSYAVHFSVFFYCCLFEGKRDPHPPVASGLSRNEQKIAPQSEFLRLPQQLDRDQWSVQEENQDKIRLFRRQTLRSLFQFTNT